MARLREPVSGGQAFALLVGAAVIVAAQHWLGGIQDPLAWLGLVLMLELVVQPLCTLGHELGHATAVMLLARRQALVVVGRGPWLPINADRLRVRFSFLPTRGVLIRGVCRYDSRGLSWRSLAWIALAGPLATLLLLVVVIAVAPLVWSQGPFVRNLVALSGLGLLGSLITNLGPRPATRAGGGAVVAMRDGDQARHAFAMHRAHKPPPGVPAAGGAKPQPMPAAGSELPPHWAPRDPKRRREFEAELRRALQPSAPGEDPAERRRLNAQLRAALTPPEELQRSVAQIERQRDRERGKTTVPPPTPDGRPT